MDQKECLYDICVTEASGAELKDYDSLWLVFQRRFMKPSNQVCTLQLRD